MLPRFFLVFVKFKVQLQYCRVLLSGVCDDSLMSELLWPTSSNPLEMPTEAHRHGPMCGITRFRQVSILSFSDEADTGQDSNRT